MLTKREFLQSAGAGLALPWLEGLSPALGGTVVADAKTKAAYGLGAERALRSITLDAAKILGLDARLGSLEVGKDGDLALYDGDPFEYTSHCIGTVIDGVPVFEGSR